MQRIFAFDPGTAALGWAVMDIDDGHIEIRACGVRLYALTRQRILASMKQRLKPEDRVRAHQRRRMRLKKLLELLQRTGLSDAGEDPHWRTSDGLEIGQFLKGPISAETSRRLLVRLIFHVHRRRGSLAMGPQDRPAHLFLEDLLLAQSKWHPVLADEAIRARIVATVFHRRKPEYHHPAAAQKSRLARLASDELIAVWRALAAEFGSANMTVIEMAVPAPERRPAKFGENDAVSQMLESCGLKATVKNRLKAQLFIQQSAADAEHARCGLTGAPFSFKAAMSAAVEIDHVVPVARGGKNGRSNLQLALADANRAKGAGDLLADIAQRNPVSATDADALRQSLRIVLDRFQAFSVPPRLLLLSARQVSSLRKRIMPVVGAKDRSSLHHHAQDAIIAGCVSTGGDLSSLPDGLSVSIEAALECARLSVRAERSTKGRIHEDTRYGLVLPESGFDPRSHVAVRKPVEGLTPVMMARIVDIELRRKAMVHAAAPTSTQSSAFGRTKRVSIAKPALGHIRLVDANGTFKAAVLPSDNHHMDIVQMRDGRWRAFAATRHERRQPGWRPVWEVNHMGGKLVMRLHKGDMVEWQTDDGRREMLMVARLSGSSGIVHFNRPWADRGSVSLVAAAASTLKKRQAKAVDANAGGRTRFRRSNAA